VLFLGRENSLWAEAIQEGFQEVRGTGAASKEGIEK
jgi:hypothetical protein